MHINSLTDNDKVVSLPKQINFEVPQFRKYPCFQNVRETVSDKLVPPPPQRFGPPPPWITPPRKKTWLRVCRFKKLFFMSQATNNNSFAARRRFSKIQPNFSPSFSFG